jgi:hypothetical protein
MGKGRVRKVPLRNSFLSWSIVFGFLALLFSSPSFPLCIFADIAGHTPSPIEAEASADLYFDGLRRKMQHRSDVKISEYYARTKLELQDGQPRNNPDAVVYGSGPHAAVIVANMRATNPDLDIVVLEAGDANGVFDNLRFTFQINTVELQNESGNNMPGLPFQPKDLKFNKETRYLNSKVPANVTVGAHEAADSQVLFHERGLPVGRRDPNTGRYTVQTEGQAGHPDLIFHPKAVILATGFGEATFRIWSSPEVPPHQPTLDLIDEEVAAFSQALLEESSPDQNIREKAQKYAPGLQTVDHLLAAARRDLVRDKTIDPMSRYDDGEDEITTYAVIGGRDGGNIAVEMLARKGKGRSQIFWFNQKAKNKPEFLGQLGDKASRYEGIGDFYDEKAANGEKVLTAINGYVQKVIKMPRGPGKKPLYMVIPVTEEGEPVLDDEGKPIVAVVKHVVWATGYDRTAARLAGGLAPEGGITRIVEVQGSRQGYKPNMNLPDKTVLGNRVVSVDSTGHETPEDVYIAGNASSIDPGKFGTNGKIPDPAGSKVAGVARPKTEWNLTVGGFLDLLTSRTAPFGRMIALNVFGKPADLVTLEKETRSDVRPWTGEIHAKVHQPFSTDVIQLQLEGKMRLTRFLPRFNLPANTKIEVQGVRGESPNELKLKISGLTSFSARRFAQMLSLHSDMTSILLDLVGKTQLTGIRINIQTREDGALKTEACKLEPM